MPKNKNLVHKIILISIAFLLFSACKKAEDEEVMGDDVMHLGDVEPVDPAINDSKLDKSDVIIYETSVKNLLFDGIAILEDRKTSIEYTKPYYDNVVNQDYDFNSGVIKYKKIGNIITEFGTDISIPINIYKNPIWNVENYSCHAKKSFSKYHIKCRNKQREFSYIYTKKKGVIALQYPCGDGNLCWYDLKSERGIFSEVKLKELFGN